MYVYIAFEKCQAVVVSYGFGHSAYTYITDSSSEIGANLVPKNRVRTKIVPSSHGANMPKSEYFRQ